YFSAATFGVRRVELVPGRSAAGQTTRTFGNTAGLGPASGFMASSLAADGRSLLVGENRQRGANDPTPPAYWIWPDADPPRARKLIDGDPLIGCRAIPNTPWGVTTDLLQPDAWIWNLETGQRVRNLGLSSVTTTEPTANGRWLVARTRDEFMVWEVGT